MTDLQPGELERMEYFLATLLGIAHSIENCGDMKNVSEYISIGVGKISYLSELLASSGDLDMLTVGANMISEAQQAQTFLKFQPLGLLSEIEKNVKGGTL